MQLNDEDYSALFPGQGFCELVFQWLDALPIVKDEEEAAQAYNILMDLVDGVNRRPKSRKRSPSEEFRAQPFKSDNPVKI